MAAVPGIGRRTEALPTRLKMKTPIYPAVSISGRLFLRTIIVPRTLDKRVIEIIFKNVSLLINLNMPDEIS